MQIDHEMQIDLKALAWGESRPHRACSPAWWQGSGLDSVSHGRKNIWTEPKPAGSVPK